MSIEAMSLVLHHSRSKGTAKLVLMGIANHEGDGGAWPAISTLMRYAGTDRRSVQRAIERLVELGELQVLRQKGGNDGMNSAMRPNLYRVKVFCPYTCDRSSQHRLKHSALPGFEYVEPDADQYETVTKVIHRGGANAAPPVVVAPPEPSLNLTTTVKKETLVIRASKLTDGPCIVRNGLAHQRAVTGECEWCGDES